MLILNKLVVAVADSGEGPGGPGPPPPLFLDQGRKNFFGDPVPPFLRVWMTGLPPPPYPLSQGLDLALCCCCINSKYCQSHALTLLVARSNSF